MTPTQLIADVGGMAGFMLGMSVATVVAFIDSGLDHHIVIVKTISYYSVDQKYR